jgi:hypothetical protein
VAANAFLPLLDSAIAEVFVAREVLVELVEKETSLERKIIYLLANCGD